MGEVHLNEVADACPNARFYFKTENMDKLSTGLNILGPGLEFIAHFGYEITENVDTMRHDSDVRIIHFLLIQPNRPLVVAVLARS